jgi:hypothetical protein
MSEGMGYVALFLLGGISVQLFLIYLELGKDVPFLERIAKAAETIEYFLQQKR